MPHLALSLGCVREGLYVYSSLPTCLLCPHTSRTKERKWIPNESMLGEGGVSLQWEACFFKNLLHKSPNPRRPLSPKWQRSSDWLIREMSPNPPSWFFQLSSLWLGWTKVTPLRPLFMGKSVLSNWYSKWWLLVCPNDLKHVSGSFSFWPDFLHSFRKTAWLGDTGRHILASKTFYFLEIDYIGPVLLIPLFSSDKNQSIDHVILFTWSSKETRFIYGDRSQNGSYLWGTEWLGKGEGTF